MSDRRKNTTEAQRNAKPKAKPRYRIPPPIRPLKPEWPEELKPAMAAIREAVTAQRLSRQMEAVELCRRIIAEATSPLRNQVEAGKMKAGEALRGIEKVVDDLLAHDRGIERWGSEKFRLKERVRGSGEWFAFEKAIAEADRARIADANNRDKQRTGPTVRERDRNSPGAQLARLIVTIRTQKPRYTHRQVCGRVDDICNRNKNEIPLLQNWRDAGATSLVAAFDSPILNSTVKKFISTAIKKAN